MALRTSYAQDFAWFDSPGSLARIVVLIAAAAALPFVLGEYYVSQLTFVWIYAIAGLGLMILIGYTGLVSFGQAAFLALGAYAAGILQDRGVPFIVALPAAAVVAAAAGVAIAVPALRMTGLFLAIATLAFAFIVNEALTRFSGLTRGNMGFMMPDIVIAGLKIDSERKFNLLCLVILVLCMMGAANLLRSPVGRAFIAIRDSRIAAQSMGIPVARYQTLSFAIGAGLTGIAGALFGHKLTFIMPEQFDINVSIEMLTLVVVGGLGSLHGVIFGAAFVILLPQLISAAKPLLPAVIAGQTGLQAAVFGGILILFIMLEPGGLYGRWLRMKQYLADFPFYGAATSQKQRSFLRSERW